MNVQGAVIHVLSAGPPLGPQILLLHGARYHSGTWRDLGTIRLLAAAGLHVVAIDLPGYGESTAGEADPETFLVEALDEANLDDPVIVAPSMSGRFVFPLLVDHPDRADALVALAPAGIDEYAPLLEGLQIESLLMWGSEDAVVPVSAMETLAESLPRSRKVVLEGASHPCYLDQPEPFHEALTAFLEEVRRDR